MMYEINHLVIEGADLSGKSTLISNLHGATNYRWNIHDRSYLSRVCCAQMYGRDKKQPIRGMWKELSNLNNVYVILLPSAHTLQERFKVRGDDVQSHETLPIMRGWFEIWASSLEGLPNVIVIREELDEQDMCAAVLDKLTAMERMTEIQTGHFVRDFARMAPEPNGPVDISLRLDPKWDFSSILFHPREKEYYDAVEVDACRVIRNEMAGNNPYGKRQGLYSRRFYYSSSDCLSSVHFLVKDKCLQVLSVLRSTDVDRNASIDLKFLCHLSTVVARKLGWPIDEIELSVRYNCAHVRHDLPKWDKDETQE